MIGKLPVPVWRLTMIKRLGFLLFGLAVRCVICSTESDVQALLTECSVEDGMSTKCPMTLSELEYNCFPTTSDECGGTTYVGEGSFCEKIDDFSVVFQCKAGQWTCTDPGPSKPRPKRWLWVVVVACFFWCRRRRYTPPNRPPYFTYCPSDITLTASSGKTTATVTWSQPRAHDPDDRAPSVAQVIGPPSGSVVVDGNTFISYKTWDEHGLSAYCHFTVIVRVVYCSGPPPFLHGRQTCSGVKRNIFGSVCSHSCEQGYQLNGASTAVCQSNGRWNTDTFPTCERVSCGSPGTVSGGHLVCPQGHLYSDLCFVTCNPGYRHTGSIFISCTSARIWTRADPCEDVEPPEFPNGCPADKQLFTGPMESPVALTWVYPDARDNSGKRVTLTSNYVNGTLTGPGAKVIRITAEDSAGNSASCSFLVTVRAKECPFLSPPTHGRVKCSHSYLEGSVCTVTCDEGYKVQGNQLLTCLASEDWDYSMPSCEAVLCPSPPQVDHGYFVCLRGHQYPESCSLVCGSGFSIELPFSIRCLANGTWTDAGACKDIQPPEFPNGCTRNVEIYGARLGQSTLVKWDPPAVLDNSGETILPTSDVPLNTAFQVGVTPVTYKAADSAGNSRSCQFSVTVKTLLCLYPDLEHPNRTQDLMTYTCPNGLVYGASCTLGCTYGYPLVGPDTITCERNDGTNPPTMYWYWAGSSSLQPQCRESVCPDLPPPANGALTCFLGNFGWDCLMSCQASFDVPSTVSGHFYCTNSGGTWIPSKVQDCVNRLRPIDTRLMSDIFYFTGSCNTSLDELRVNFITRMNNSQWRDACANGACTVENVQVTCGPVSTTNRGKRHAELLRQRRDADQLIFISFELSLGYSPGGTYGEIEAKRDTIASTLFSEASSGHFNIGDLVANEYRFGYPIISAVCPPGSMFRALDTNPSLSCAGCGAGYYLPEGSTQCEACPVGSYTELDNATSCTPCPPGWSTPSTGSKNSSDCKELCTAGSFSHNSFVPCQPCPPGQYQSRDGAMTCDLCPVGTWTLTGNTTSQAHCKVADVVVSNTSLSVMVENQTSALTISAWIKSVQASTLSNVSVSFLPLPLSSQSQNSSLTTDSKSLSTQLTLLSGSWSHIVVTIDSQSGLTAVHFQNSSSSYIQSTPFAAVAMTTFAIDVQDGSVLASGFRAWDKVLSEEETAESSQTCHGNDKGTMLSWSPAASSLQIPSKCDAIDECLGNPCGVHPCENRVGGFVCHCQGGWSGDTCSTPPDPCYNNHCQQEAMCLSGADNYTCVCPSGFAGSLCELIVVDGGWGDWSTWGDCTTSCGEGVQQRQRPCNNPTPFNGGANCSGNATEVTACRESVCEADGARWRDWSEWSACNVTCGAGTRTRHRSCDTANEQDDQECQGPNTEGEACSSTPCPVHGGWNNWLEWSQCSVTCGEGQQSRERTCSNPLPAYGGDPCSNGSTTENKTCTLSACPKCPALIRSYSTILVCNTTTSPYLKTCDLSCAPSFASPNAPFPQYRCGEETNYLWSHQVDAQSDTTLPSCSTQSLPTSGTMSQNITMNTGCHGATSYEVKNQVQQNMQASLPCIKSSACQTQVSTGCNSPAGRRKRSTGSLVVYFNMTVDFSSFAGLSENDTDKIEQFARLLQMSEQSAAMVAFNDTEKLFTVTVGGVRITPDLSTASYTAGLHCPPGSVSVDGFCVACPAGSKEEGGECVSCPLGQYQNQIGSTSCKSCPDDKTWHLLGAISVSQCIVPLNSTGPNRPDGQDGPSDNTVTVVIAVCTCLVVLVCGAVAGVVIYKCTRQTPPDTRKERVFSPRKIFPLPQDSMPPLPLEPLQPPPYSEA